MVNNTRGMRLLTVLLVLSLIVGFTSFGSALAADTDQIEVQLNGEKIALFTRSDLSNTQNFNIKEQLYSTIDTMPRKLKYATKGVLLKDILNAALANQPQSIDDINRMEVNAIDDWSKVLDKSILDEERYYYPLLDEGVETGKEKREPIIALESINKPDFTLMDDVKGLRLFVGQQDVNQTTSMYLGKYIATINLIIEDSSGEDGQPDQITLSWTDNPQTTQTAAWRTSSDMTTGTVQYMKQIDFDADFSGAQEKEAVCSPLSTGFNHFEVTMDSLLPNTAYAYRVGTEGHWSEPASFTTAAVTDHFSFMYMGDVQNGHDQWGKLLHKAYTNYPELKFTMLGGDLVDDGESSQEWALFFNAAAGVFDHMPLMPALGNHDNTVSELYFKSFALPTNGPANLAEHHYSFDYGNAHFVVLDSNRMGDDSESKNWLDQDLKNSSKEWKFVMFHHPPYPAKHDNHAEPIRDNWVPILERNDVDLALVAHQHVYMRTYPMYEGQIKQNPQDGITYLMGNSGSKFYSSFDEHDYIAKIKTNISSYQIIDIDGDVLTLTSKDFDGHIIDQYTIDKGENSSYSFSINSVKLLDKSNQEVTTVSKQGGYRIQAKINNYCPQVQDALVMTQIRYGKDATESGGGEVLESVSLQTSVPRVGADMYADFSLPDISAGNKVYVDVFVWDGMNNQRPLATPYQKLSFNIVP